MSTSGHSAVTSGAGAVAVVVATCQSPAVLQPPPTAGVPSPSAVSAASIAAVRSSVGTPTISSASSSSSVSSSEEDDEMTPPLERHWKRSVSSDTREQLVDGMLAELRRITGRDNLHHLRMCASRYESLVWKKSSNETEYKQKLERRIQSLRRQPSQHEIQVTAAQLQSISSTSTQTAVTRHSSSAKSDGRRSKHRRGSSHHRSSSAVSSPPSPERDEQYFARLRAMKANYRDEVALVFRELCRVNTVIQHSASLRRHESNNLGDFLANLKKIIYLLEQQPDEMHGMIPPRKRTLEYLDVVESHIQRKVLPILYRLRHTYSTILRPLLLNYLRNCTRGSRRL